MHPNGTGSLALAPPAAAAALGTARNDAAVPVSRSSSPAAVSLSSSASPLASESPLESLRLDPSAFARVPVTDDRACPEVGAFVLP